MLLYFLTIATYSVLCGASSVRVGALFAVHGAPAAAVAGARCGPVREHYGIQRVEATLQALDALNSARGLLGAVGLKLRAELRDSCWAPPTALRQTIDLVRDAIALPEMGPPAPGPACESRGRGAAREPLAAVLGPGASAAAVQVQNLLQLFSIPQVSYSATSRELSDRARFSTFFRVVPSDAHQAKLLVALLRAHNWTYVHAFYTDESYGQSGMAAFREAAGAGGVCVAREAALRAAPAQADVAAALALASSTPAARVVLCWCEGRTARALLHGMAKMEGPPLRLVASDGWADRRDVPAGVERWARGALTLRIRSPYLRHFDTHYHALSPHNNSRNPWFREFWEQKFNCSLSASAPAGVARCTGSESLAAGYTQEPKLALVVRGVHALARALHAMRAGECGRAGAGLCAAAEPFNVTLYAQYLQRVRFQAPDGGTVAFDENGDPPPELSEYDVMSFEGDDERGWRYERVGRWRRGRLRLRGGHQATVNVGGGTGAWGGGAGTPSRRSPPLLSKYYLRREEAKFAVVRVDFVWQTAVRAAGVEAVCSRPCPLGSWARRGAGRARCCWSCVPCGVLGVPRASPPGCTPCAPGTRPGPARRTCVPAPLEWGAGRGARAVTAAAGAAGLATAAFAAIVFWRYRQTPVVKSASRELCALLLCCAGVCHVSALAAACRPGGAACALTRLGAPALAGVYASVLTRTVRVARLVAAAERRPRLLSSRAQVCAWLALTLPGAICCIWSAGVRGWGARELHPARWRRVLACGGDEDAGALPLLPLTPALLLLAACLALAVRTRRLPHNFNETRFIGAAAYSTGATWAAFVPLYVARGEGAGGAATLAACVSLSAGACVALSLGPRLWVCLFRPERNTREHFLTATSIRCHLGRYRPQTGPAAPAQSGPVAARPGVTNRSAGCQTAHTSVGDVCTAAGVCARVSRVPCARAGEDEVLIVLLPHRHLLPGHDDVRDVTHV